jgi:phage terminase small subunit
MSDVNELNDKQRTFCECYLVHLNATRAAIEAGYSAETARSIASTMLTKVNIQHYIDELKQKRSERLKIEADWVLQRFVDISNRCMAAEPVMEWIDGELKETGEWKFDSAGANKATDQIARHIGFYAKDKEKAQESKPKRKIVVNLNIPSIPGKGGVDDVPTT